MGAVYHGVGATQASSKNENPNFIKVKNNSYPTSNELTRAQSSAQIRTLLKPKNIIIDMPKPKTHRENFMVGQFPYLLYTGLLDFALLLFHFLLILDWPRLATPS